MGGKQGKVNTKKRGNKTNARWIAIAITWSLLLSGGASLFSAVLLTRVNILVAFIILIAVILVGIVFDMVGIAVTTAEEPPFHSMASRKVNGAKTAIKLMRNAEKVSNFCNDVIGDVCGIVSGSIGILIVTKVVVAFSFLDGAMLNIAFGMIISALTIGGKAIGKGYAMNNSNDIVFKVSRIIQFFNKG